MPRRLLSSPSSRRSPTRSLSPTRSSRTRSSELLGLPAKEKSMRYILSWLASSLLVLSLAGQSLAQPPRDRDRPPGPFGRPGGPPGDLERVLGDLKLSERN